MVIKSDRVSIFAYFTFIVSSTIGFASINYASIAIIGIVRVVFLALLVVTSILGWLIVRRSGEISTAIFLFVFMFLYGILLSANFMEYEVFKRYLTANFFMTVFGIISIGAVKFIDFPERSTRYIIYFFLVSLVVHFLVGSISLDFPPRLNFEFLSKHGVTVLYSQGITKFYGFAFVMAIIASNMTESKSAKIFLWGLALFSFFLSFLGGARGDFAAALLVGILVIISFGAGGWIVLILLSFSAFLFLSTFLESYTQDFLLLQRFLIAFENQNLGQRDILALQSFFILTEDARCAFFGCGFTYFQFYYNYSPGLYPHNYLLEFLITWGVPLTIFIFTTAIMGFRKSLRDSKNKPHIFTYIFFFLVALKGGELMASWIVTSFTFYFSGIGLYALRRS